jgi:hypothetical protein
VTGEQAAHGWQTTEVEWRISSVEMYVVARAYRSPFDGWAATYCGPKGPVDIGTVDDEDNAVWWESAGDAIAACKMHRQRVQAGYSAQEAAEYVRVNGDERGLELAAEE